MLIKGREGISAKVIQDSISQGIRIITFEWEYPRFIHAEVMTHRMLSKNAASSRAIPVDKMHQHIIDHTAMPVFWGLNQPGMQASVEADEVQKAVLLEKWINGRDMAIQTSRILSKYGLHKQLANRPTEAYQMMKTVVTATEWANFLWLRNHKDAQPEFRELAECVERALNCSVPLELNQGQWHVPYVLRKILPDGSIEYADQMIAAQALVVSASCCAQVSYRRLDDDYEKALLIYDKLINNVPVHASPVEHQAKPMRGLMLPIQPHEDGITHIRMDNSLWSGNFRGWIQHRQLIVGNTKW